MLETIKQFIKKIPILNTLAIRLYRYARRVQGRYRLKLLSNTSPIRLVIGAAGIYDNGWLNTDIEYLNLLNSNHWEAYFQRNSIDAILAEHVWEHLSNEDGLEAAKRCFEYLRPGGYLRVAVPDGYHPDQGYLAHVKPGGTGVGADDHKVLYNHVTFADILKQAGFRVVLLEYFDFNGKFHYKEWNPREGKIHRSMRFDSRNTEGNLNYSSLIIDAYKDT